MIARRTLSWTLLAATVLSCYRSESRPPLGSPGNVAPVEPAARMRVDLIVLVDNSGSMAQEQAELARRFPELIAELIGPPDENGDTAPDAPPLDDLHVGVVSTDVGTLGFPVSTCTNADVGDDGCFLHHPRPAGGGCAAEYPAFLGRDAENAAAYSVEQLGDDFACLATLGTSGCGFEQQLEAMRRAAMENQLAGRCNAGFLRDDSVLVLLFVTDENDCSVPPEHSEMFDQDRTDLGHLGIRCYLNPGRLRPVEWFRDQLLTLRPGTPDSIVVAELVGVPPVPECEVSGAGIAGCLYVPEMEERIDPAFTSQLLISCHTAMGLAFPPVRIVRFARLWYEAGGGAYVASLCREDWTASLAGIRREIAGRLRPDCFPYELDFDALDAPPGASPSCAADCVLVETLPADRRCALDVACPPASCPPATLDQVLHDEAAPCRTPTADNECEPLARDLGIVESPSGPPLRGCLVRQDPGTFDEALGRCVPPAEPRGWRYEPSEWHDVFDGSCPSLDLPESLRSERADGATFRLHCRSLRCPAERQCGSREHPADVCCPEGESCERDSDGAGSCRPAEP